jgi:uncharacterized protein (UPF0335 family)
MATDTEPGEGHNFDLSPEDLKEIEQLTRNIIALEKKRDDINADINSDRKKIRALGIDLDAWKASLRRFKMDPDDRDNFDRSRELVDRALGIPVQADLFETVDEDDENLPANLH